MVLVLQYYTTVPGNSITQQLYVVVQAMDVQGRFDVETVTRRSKTNECHFRVEWKTLTLLEAVDYWLRGF